MQLENVLFGRAIRLLLISEWGRGRIYGVHLARACEDRYGFWRGPREVEDFDLAKGVAFLHGYFQDRIVIERLQVFNNGLMAEINGDTDECDAFLHDFVDWLKADIGVDIIQEPSSPRFYYSNVEVTCSFSLGEKLPQLARIGQEITKKLHEYGQTAVSDVELVSLGYGRAGEAPTFRFERKEGVPEERRIYLCAAPLRTKDHLPLLKELESILVS
jgi:hypothetical protein